MTRRIAILTPDPADEGHRTRWAEVLETEAATLLRAGLEVEGRSWAEPLDGFDLAMPLLVWGYHRAGPAWHAAVAGWAAAGLELQNPPSVLKWNADKLYLGRLADRGAPVVPTLYVERVDEAALHGAATSFGSDRLIAKPRVSASAWQTIRWSPGAPLDGGPSGPALIQPYLSSIEREGEVSLIYLDGAYSHSIVKRPRAGDFRVQPEHGAEIVPHLPAADERAAAEAILATVDEDLLYARIDIARDAYGAPVLMELELVEPDLYLEHDPGGGAMFAEAVARAAGA